MYLAAFQAAALLAAIRAEGAIAVAFNLLHHRAFQLKGTDATVVPLDASDVERAKRYTEAFCADIGLLGYSAAYGRALLWFDPAELTRRFVHARCGVRSNARSASGYAARELATWT